MQAATVAHPIVEGAGAPGVHDSGCPGQFQSATSAAPSSGTLLSHDRIWVGSLLLYLGVLVMFECSTTMGQVGKAPRGSLRRMH
jgi:hypothetical protein